MATDFGQGGAANTGEWWSNLGPTGQSEWYRMTEDQQKAADAARVNPILAAQAAEGQKYMQMSQEELQAQAQVNSMLRAGLKPPVPTYNTYVEGYNKASQGSGGDRLSLMDAARPSALPPANTMGQPSDVVAGAPSGSLFAPPQTGGVINQVGSSLLRAGGGDEEKRKRDRRFIGQ